MRFSGAADLLLRLSVAFSFLFPPVNALLYPYDWIGYFPKFMRGIVPDPVLLHVFGLVEVALGLWLLSGKRIFIPALVSAALLILIVLFNLNDLQVLFRDIALALAALALAAAHRPRKEA